MLSFIEIVPTYWKKINILYEGKERSAKTKLMPAKLSAVLANFGFLQIFQKINMWGLVSQRYSFL